MYDLLIPMTRSTLQLTYLCPGSRAVYLVFLLCCMLSSLIFDLSSASLLSSMIWARAPSQVFRLSDSKSLNIAGDRTLVLHILYSSQSCHQNFQLSQEVLHGDKLACHAQNAIERVVWVAVVH